MYSSHSQTLRIKVVLIIIHIRPLRGLNVYMHNINGYCFLGTETSSPALQEAVPEKE